MSTKKAKGLVISKEKGSIRKFPKGDLISVVTHIDGSPTHLYLRKTEFIDVAPSFMCELLKNRIHVHGRSGGGCAETIAKDGVRSALRCLSKVYKVGYPQLDLFLDDLKCSLSSVSDRESYFRMSSTVETYATATGATRKNVIEHVEFDVLNFRRFLCYCLCNELDAMYERSGGEVKLLDIWSLAKYFDISRAVPLSASFIFSQQSKPLVFESSERAKDEYDAQLASFYSTATRKLKESEELMRLCRS